MDRSKHFPEHGEAFKKALKVPVIITSQHDPVKIEANIAAGKNDLQSMGRQLFIDPEYVNKLMEGREKEIVRCKRSNTCLMRCLAGLVPACPDNPNLGREYTLAEYKISPWKNTESIIPEGLIRAPMPALERPWWKREIEIIEKSWRPRRGRTVR
jgi:hypothetical protein